MSIKQLYTLFVLIFIMPLNGYIISKGDFNIIFGGLLILMQLPWILTVVDKMENNND